MATTPFIRDVPAAEALAAWRAACAAAGCPARVEAVRLGAARGRRPRDGRAGLGDALVAVVRRLGDGRHRRARRATRSARARARRCFLDAGAFVVVDTGDPLPDGFDAVVMREHVHYDDAGRAELRGAVAPYQHVRSIGEDVSATELLLPDGPPAARRSTSPPPRRRAPSTCVVRRRARRRRAADRRRDPPVGTEPAPGVILDTNSLMLAAQAEAGAARRGARAIVPDDPERDRRGACATPRRAPTS